MIEMKEFPKACGTCPFYSEIAYTCHNERGNEAFCSLGYFRGQDMRDWSYRTGRHAGEKDSRCELQEPKTSTNVSES
jgi:hypothetical protein